MRVNTTIGDIAEQLGLSRNTVSKVFNGGHSVPEATRQKVIKKAVELNYKNMGRLTGNIADEPAEPGGYFILISGSIMSDVKYWANIIKATEQHISSNGYTLLIANIRSEQMINLELPHALSDRKVKGIICLELYYKPYLDKLFSLETPIVSIDMLPDPYSVTDRTLDIVIPENIGSVGSLVSRLIDSGCQKIGFVGDPNHCMSFRERFVGFHSALFSNGAEFIPALSILHDNHMPYCDVDWICERLKEMPGLPDAFICANDSIAVPVLEAVRKLGVKVPDELIVTGFDNLTESVFERAHLSTVDVNCATIGHKAAEQLIFRVNHPEAPSQTVHLKTTPIFRGTTK